MDFNKHDFRQSPGGNSSIGLSWNFREKEQREIEEKKEIEEQKKLETRNQILEKILKAEEQRKMMNKKEVKTSVKVNQPPGGGNHFSLG